MKRVLIQSVGTGTRADTTITKLLGWSIKESRPDYVVFLVSRESRPHAEDVARNLPLEAQQYEIFETSTIANVEAIYRHCCEIFRRLAKEGFVPEDMEVDYTSGTKAMTAGLTLAAVTHHCGRLKYVDGDRRDGVVIDGTEREERIQPRRIWADEQLRLAKDFCQALRFDAALAIIGKLNPAWLGAYEQRLKDGLEAVAYGYGQWDRFDYVRASGELRKVLDSDVPELEPFRPDQTILRQLVQLKPAAEFSADRLADVFNNAQRRLDEGRYDDGLARLYRLTEMLAQWILAYEFHINTADVDLAKVPDHYRPKLEPMRNHGGKIQIGLEKSYELLNDLGHSVGQTFCADDSIKALLHKRNHSLLAHGLEPIEKKDVVGLQTRLEKFVASIVPDFKQRCTELEFPWRRPNRSQF